MKSFRSPSFFCSVFSSIWNEYVSRIRNEYRNLQSINQRIQSEYLKIYTLESKFAHFLHSLP